MSNLMYIEAVFKDNGISFKIDECFENEGRLQPFNVSLVGVDPAKINVSFSAAVLDPINDPANFTFIDGLPSPPLNKIPVQPGFEVVDSWNIVLKEGRTDRFGWIYRSKTDHFACSNVALENYTTRFRKWVRISVKQAHKNLAKRIIDCYEDFCGRYCCYNLKTITNMLGGFPYKLNIVWENVRVRGIANSEGPEDPPQWTYVKLEPEVNTPGEAKDRRSGTKDIDDALVREKTRQKESLKTARVFSSLNESANIGGGGGGGGGGRDRLDSASSNTSDPPHPPSLTTSGDEEADIKRLVEFSVYYRLFAHNNFPYNPLDDSEIATLHTGIPENWSAVRGFNFCTTHNTDDNGWEYSNSFWNPGEDKSEPQHKWTNSPANVHDKNIQESRMGGKKIVRGLSAKDVLNAAGAANGVGGEQHKSNISSLATDAAFSDPELYARRVSDVINATEQLDEEVLDENDALSKIRISRRRSFNSATSSAVAVVKRRLWCRVICPSNRFSVLYELLNKQLYHMPKGIMTCGNLTKVGRGLIANEKLRFHEVLNNEIRYFTPTLMGGDRGELKGSFPLSDAYVVEKPDNDKSVKGPNPYSRITMYSKDCDRDPKFGPEESYSHLVIAFSATKTAATSSNGEDSSAVMNINASLKAELAHSFNRLYRFFESDGFKSNSFIVLKSRELSQVADDMIAYKRNKKIAISPEQLQQQQQISKKYKFKGSDGAEKSRSDVSRHENGKKFKLVFYYDTKKHGNSLSPEQTLQETKNLRHSWTQIIRSQIALLSSSRIFDVDGGPPFQKTPNFEITYFDMDNQEFKGDQVADMRQFVVYKYTNFDNHVEFYLAKIRAEKERHRIVEEEKRKKIEEENIRLKDNESQQLRKTDESKVSYLGGGRGGAGGGGVVAVSEEQIPIPSQVVDLTKDYITSKRGILVPISMIKGINAKKKDINERVFRSRWIWLDQDKGGKWALFWAKESKTDSTSKNVLVRDFSTIELGSILPPEGHGRQGSKRRSIAPLFFSEKDNDETLTFLFKSMENPNTPPGLDIQFSSVDEALSWSDVIHRLKNE